MCLLALRATCLYLALIHLGRVSGLYLIVFLILFRLPIYPFIRLEAGHSLVSVLRRVF